MRGANGTSQSRVLVTSLLACGKEKRDSSVGTAQEEEINGFLKLKFPEEI